MELTSKIIMISLAILTVLGFFLGYRIPHSKPIDNTCQKYQQNLFSNTMSASEESADVLKKEFKNEFENFQFSGMVSKSSLIDKLISKAKLAKTLENKIEVVAPFINYVSNKYFQRANYGYEIIGDIELATVNGTLEILKATGEHVKVPMSGKKVLVVPGRIVKADSSAIRYDLIFTPDTLEMARMTKSTGDVKFVFDKDPVTRPIYQALDGSLLSQAVKDADSIANQKLAQDFAYMKEAYIGNSSHFVEAGNKQLTDDEAMTYIKLASSRAFMEYELESIEYMAKGNIYGEFQKMTPQGAFASFNGTGQEAYYAKINFEGMKEPMMVLFNGADFNPIKVVPNSNSTLVLPNKIKVVLSQSDDVVKMIEESGKFLASKTVIVNDLKKVHFIFMLDESTSMVGDKWADTKAATLGFIKMLNDKHNAKDQDFLITMITFASDAIVRVSGQQIENFKNATLDGFTGGETDFEKPLELANAAARKFMADVDVTYAYFFTDGEAFYPEGIEAAWKENVENSQNISFLKLVTVVKGDLVLSSFAKNLNSDRCTYDENPEAKHLFLDVKKFVGLGE